MASPIFINYRRSDSRSPARTLLASLAGEFSRQAVFLDTSVIKPGETWADRLQGALEQAQVLLALIGPGWLTAADEYGRRRLDDEDDWVRKELLFALDNGKIIIPLLLDGAQLPPAEALPAALRPLLDHQAYPLRTDHWDNDLRPLLAAIQTTVPHLHRADPPSPIPHHQLTLVPRLRHTVFGRQALLEHIHASLQNGEPLVLVNGLGGIGKTTVALKYIEAYGAHYRHVAWVEVNEGVAEALLAAGGLIDALRLRERLNQLPPEQLVEQGFRLILRTLNDLGDCLLVIDNANKLADLYKRQKELHSLRCKVLVTSRARPDDWRNVAVEELPPAEAAKLFRDFFPVPPGQEDRLQRILGRIEYHTLLTELLARSARKSKLALERLDELVEEEFIHHKDLNRRRVATGLSGEKEDLPRQERVERYIAMIFDKITSLGEEEKKYLRYFACLPPNEYPEEELLQYFQIKEAAENDFRDVLDGLVEKGWILRKEEEEGFTCKQHALVQDLVVRELGVDVDNCQPVLEFFASALHYDATDPKFDLAEKFLGIEFGEHLSDLFEKEESGDLSYLLDRMAWLYENYGQYQRAKELGERALSMALELFEEKHATISTRQSNLANVYRNLGDYGRARDLLEAALASALENFGERHPNVAVSQSNLANVYSDLGDYGRARDLLEAALASDLENFGERHPNVAVSQSNLANVYSDLGDYGRARDLLEAALASALENFGERHPNVAVSQSNLANVYRNLGDYGRARDLLEAALASDLENFGERHPNVAVSQSNLANVYRNLGDYGRARDLLEAALASDLENFGERHPNVAVSQSNLANVYRNLGDYGRARELLEAALELETSHYGENHPYVAIDYELLINVYRELGEMKKAEAAARKCYEINLATLGPEHPSTRRAKERLGSEY